jgi:hypothetical protein
MNKQFTFSIRKNGYLQRCSFTAPVESGYVITNNYCPNALIIGEGSMLSQIAIPQNGETENEFIQMLKSHCDKRNIKIVLDNVNNKSLIAHFADLGISLYSGKVYNALLSCKDIIKSYLV